MALAFSWQGSEAADGLLVSGGADASYNPSAQLPPITVTGSGDRVLHVDGTGSTLTLTDQTVHNGSVAAGIVDVLASNGGEAFLLDGSVGLTGVGTTGVRTETGGEVSIDGASIATTTNAASQRGLVSIGGGSLIDADDATVTLGVSTNSVNDLVAVTAQNGGAVMLSGSAVSTRGGTGGIGNHALTATGAGSTVTVSGGTVSTLSRGSFGAWAQDGGLIQLNAGAQVSTTGAQNTTTVVGSHGLYAAGVGSRITGNGVSVSTGSTIAQGARAEGGGAIALTSSQITTAGTYVQSPSIIGAHGLIATGAGSSVTGTGLTVSVKGNYANGARAEQGGVVTLTGSKLSTTGGGSTNDPTAGARVVSGGRLTMSGAGSAITATGQFGHGLAISGAGSRADLSDTAITASGNRSIGVQVNAGGALALEDSTVLALTGVMLDNSTAQLIDTVVRTNGDVGYGVRGLAGSGIVITGGSVTTEKRDAAGLSAGSSTITATGVTVVTLGPDNAIGVLADGASTITLNGGSVTTRGDAVRASSYPHALAARNPGGLLVADATSVDTFGYTAMGAVADDGGHVRLTGNTIHTRGDLSYGLYAIVEQVGPQFAADITGSGLTIVTEGADAHGAQAQQNRLEAPSTVHLADTTVTTGGERSVGLRAILAGTVEAERTVVTTTGELAHGMLARDDPSSVTIRDQSSITTSGVSAHGAVAQNGGRVDGFGSTVTASGQDAAALFVYGETAPSFANFTDSVLTNTSGAAIGVAGAGTVTLNRVSVGGSGQWLRAATADDFPPLTTIDPPLTGIADTPEDTTPVEPTPDPDPDFENFSMFAPLAVPGAATIHATASVLNGSAFTAPGSISDVTLDEGTVWNMNGSSNLTSLMNDASSILFSAPTGDAQALSSYMTLTTVDYAGAGGLLQLNTWLGDDTSPSDRLVIDGGTGSGDSIMRIVQSGGLGAVTAGNGILVVDAVGGATTEAGAFALDAPVIAGPYEYSLYRGSVDTSAPDSWFLRSTVDCSGPSAPIPPCPDPADVRAEVSLYAALPAMAGLYGRTIIDTLHERVGEEEQLRGRQVPDDDENANGVWGRLVYVGGRREGGDRGVYDAEGPRFDYELYAIQGGIDLYRLEHDDGVRDHAGLYGAFGVTTAEVKSHTGLRAGENQVEALSVGAYWTRFDDDGAYLDGVLQYSWYDFKARSERLPRLDGRARGFAASLEGGKPFDIKDGWKIEPQAQLVYQHFFSGHAQDPGGRFRFDETDSLVGRLGVRVDRTWIRKTDEGELRRTTGWGRLNLLHEFLDRPTTSFETETGYVPFAADTGETWLELNGGLTRQFSEEGAFYLNASYSWDLDDRGQAWTGKLGLRFNW